ncbi:MAG: hypothetical protein OCU18_05020 [Candidatus Syntrophoarchaeum sp.]|nr:hypothetical protein [Candidatus Syntrophoarchaeum sp.]
MRLDEMIPSNIEKEDVIKAIEEIDERGLPPSRRSTKFVLVFNGKQYPPKYVLSLANKYANSEELKSSEFSGGQETNGFLQRLGFDIEEKSSSGRELILSSDKPVEPPQNRHNERCPGCKNVVERMLKKIYGDVKPNYKFNIGTNPENFRDTLHYEDFKRIFMNLQNYRGNENFVYANTLPNCDYFVSNPRFIVEFDETQHFTHLRKISLQSYPQNIKLGFSPGKWIKLCEEINAKDNDPIYRDEQRAWYDTLRDFLPVLTGNLEPTVRLYSKEMPWCSLDPDNPADLARFKNIIEGRRKDLNGWVATVILQSDSDSEYSNDDRMEELRTIVDQIVKEISGDGVILFPGGWFYTEEKEPSTIYNWAEEQIRDILIGIEEKIIVCIGIDGSVDKEGYSHDQIGIAVSKNGIDAMGRKFHPAPQEMGYVKFAPNYLSKEDSKSRIFELNGVKYFMCVCYDTYGIRHKNLPNPDVDVVLNLVHCFYPVGKGPSGASYFAKHGFAGASKRWKCPVFGAAVFFNRGILENWPTGVYWNQGDKSTQKWRYEDNPIEFENKFEISIKEGTALIRIYNLGKIKEVSQCQS